MALGVNSASDSLGILINREKYCCNIKKKQDQGASVQKTVWTVNRCINGGILSPALVVVCFSGLYCAVLACTGLYLTVPEYSGLYLVVLGSALL